MRDDKYDFDKPWWDQPETFTRGYSLLPPYGSITVGSDPLDGMTKQDSQRYDAIINVSSSSCAVFQPARPDQRTYWFPIIEVGRWPVVYLVWLKEVLDFHYERGHKIYLHCHAGIFRSPSAALLWLQSRGHSKGEALLVNKDSKDSLYKRQKHQGNLHPGTDKILSLLHKQKLRGKPFYVESLGSSFPWDREFLNGLNRRKVIKRDLFWFYYKPKHWLQRCFGDLRDWFQRKGSITEGFGFGTYQYRRKKFWSRMRFAEPLVTETYGVRTVGNFVWLDGAWVRSKVWEKQPNGRWEYRWLLRPCTVCKGQGSVWDGKKVGEGHSFCEACDRTGVRPSPLSSPLIP
jgi:hypothetical protein